MTSFVGGKQASEILGVHQRTLYQWEEKGWIETIRTQGGKRLYNVNKYLAEKQETIKKSNKSKVVMEDNERKKIVYVRVSSHSQKDDLERQKEYMATKYPSYEIIEDIGSGINMNRRGLKKIIHLAIEGKVDEVVVAYKDRLCRFGFELVEDLIKKYSNGRIVIENEEEDMEPEEELAKDVLQIMNIFVAKMNGLRKYKS